MSVWWCSDCKIAFAPGPVCPRCGKVGGVAQPVPAYSDTQERYWFQQTPSTGLPAALFSARKDR